MAINKVFIKIRFLNYLISSGMLFANTNKCLTDQHHVVVAKNGSII